MIKNKNITNDVFGIQLPIHMFDHNHEQMMSVFSSFIYLLKIKSIYRPEKGRNKFTLLFPKLESPYPKIQHLTENYKLHSLIKF